jgi:hypothetical protein
MRPDARTEPQLEHEDLEHEDMVTRSALEHAKWAPTCGDQGHALNREHGD